MTDYYVDQDYDGGYEGDRDGQQAEPEAGPRGGMPGPGRRAPVEGRTTWLYLGLLGALFVGMAVTARACGPDSATPTDLVPNDGETPAEVAGVAVRLEITVDSDIVTVRGSVPDEGARQQILQAAAAQYGAENVIDQLSIDETTTLDDGVVSVTGGAPFGDDRPSALRDAIIASLGLRESEFTVQEGEVTVTPVAISAVVTDGIVRLEGVVPDTASIAELVAAVEAVWGPGSADPGGLTVGSTAWDEGTVILTGSVEDRGYESFPAEIIARFGDLVQADVSGVELLIDPVALAAANTAITEALAGQSITFAPNSAEIEAVSDEVIVTIAEQLNLIGGVPVEVVGHTDSLGVPEENQLLSEQRAQAVVARLIEIGVDGSRLTPRGAGADEPVASNDTAAGRTQNRRIQFVIEGAPAPAEEESADG